jgi:hypothetical protein
MKLPRSIKAKNFWTSSETNIYEFLREKGRKEEMKYQRVDLMDMNV